MCVCVCVCVCVKVFVCVKLKVKLVVVTAERVYTIKCRQEFEGGSSHDARLLHKIHNLYYVNV